MTLIVLEQIAAAIETRVAATTGVTVIRPSRLQLPAPENMQIWLWQGDAFKNEAQSCEGNPYYQAWDQQFALDLIVRASDADTTPIDTRINEFLGLVLTKITAPAGWERWGNLAMYTMIDSVQSFPLANGDFCGLELTLTVTYRTPENDPYTPG